MAEIIPTTVVGSYPQPEWLIDRDNLRSRLRLRVRVRELWRIPEPFLEQAQNDCYPDDRALEGVQGATALHSRG